MRNNIEMNENNAYMNPYIPQKNNLNPVFLNKEPIIQKKNVLNYQFNNLNTVDLGNLKNNNIDSYFMHNLNNNNIKIDLVPLENNINIKKHCNNCLNTYPRNEYNNMRIINGLPQNMYIDTFNKGIGNEININSGANQFKDIFSMNNDNRNLSMYDFYEADKSKNIMYLNNYNNLNKNLNNSLFFQNNVCNMNNTNILDKINPNKNFCLNTNFSPFKNNKEFYENSHNINDIHNNSYEKIIRKNIVEDIKKIKNNEFNNEINNNNTIENENKVSSFRENNKIPLIPNINQENLPELKLNINKVEKVEQTESFNDSRLNKTSEYCYDKARKFILTDGILNNNNLNNNNLNNNNLNNNNLNNNILNNYNLNNVKNSNPMIESNSNKKKEPPNPLTHEILNLHNSKNTNINECSCGNVKNENFLNDNEHLNTNSFISSNNRRDVNKNNESFSDDVTSLNHKMESITEENDFFSKANIESKEMYKDVDDYLFKNMKENNSLISSFSLKNQEEIYPKKELCSSNEELDFMKMNGRNNVDEKMIRNQEYHVRNIHEKEENNNITEKSYEMDFKKNLINNSTSEFNEGLCITDTNNYMKEHEKENNEKMSEGSNIEKYDFTKWKSHNKLMKNIISSYNENIDMENHGLYNLLFDFYGYNKDIFKNYLLSGDENIIKEVMKYIIKELSEEKNNKIIEKLIFLKFLFNEYGHTDHPNLISLNNFKLIFKNYKNIFSSEKVVLFMFNCLDRGERYHITETDFIIGMLACSPYMDNDIKCDTGKLRHQLIFRAYDLDRDGYLSDNEMVVLLYHIYELSKDLKIGKLKDNKNKLKDYVISEKNRIMKYCSKISYDYFYDLIINKEIEGTCNLLRSNYDMADTIKKYFLYTYARNINIENFINNDTFFFITTRKRESTKDDMNDFNNENILNCKENNNSLLDEEVHSTLHQNNICANMNGSVSTNTKNEISINMDKENLVKCQFGKDINIDDTKNEKLCINNCNKNESEKKENSKEATEQISNEDISFIEQDVTKKDNFNNHNISKIQIYEKKNDQINSNIANVYLSEEHIKRNEVDLNNDDKNKNNENVKHEKSNSIYHNNENNCKRLVNNYGTSEKDNCASAFDSAGNVKMNNKEEKYEEKNEEKNKEKNKEKNEENNDDIYHKQIVMRNISHVKTNDKMREQLIKENRNEINPYFNNNNINMKTSKDVKESSTNLNEIDEKEQISHTYSDANQNKNNYNNNAHIKKNLDYISEYDISQNKTKLNDRNILNESLKNSDNIAYGYINSTNDRSVINRNNNSAMRENPLVHSDEEIKEINSKKVCNNLSESTEQPNGSGNYAVNWKKKDNINNIRLLENKNDLNSTINIKSHCNIRIYEELKRTKLYKEQMVSKNSSFNEDENNPTNDIHNFIYKKNEDFSGNNNKQKNIIDDNDKEDRIYREKEKNELPDLKNNLYENILTYKKDNIDKDCKQVISNNESKKYNEHYDGNVYEKNNGNNISCDINGYNNNNNNRLTNNNDLNNNLSNNNNLTNTNKLIPNNYISDKDMKNENIRLIDIQKVKNSNECLPHFGRNDELDIFFKNKEFYDEHFLDDKIDKLRETVKIYRQKYIKDHRLNTLNQDIAFKIFTIFYKVCYRKKRDDYSSYFDVFRICSYNDILLLCDEVAKLFKLENSLEYAKLPCKVFGDIHGNLFDIMDFFNLYNWPMHNSMNELIPINNLINFENINYSKIYENSNYCDKTKWKIEEIYNEDDIKYIFLGNYVNRGDHSLEVICFLFSLKILFPKHIYLLRGNHEDRLFNYIYGFYKDIEIKMKKNMETLGLINYQNEVIVAHSYELFNRINDALEFLPLSILLDKNILCIHGGIGDSVHNISDYVNLHKPILIPQYVDRNSNNQNENIKKIIIDTLWSDPINYNDEQDLLLIKNSVFYDIIPSNRGKITFKFGKHRLHDFLKNNKLKMVIRGHECVHDGYKYMFKKKLLTLFSARNYCKKYKNNASNAFIIKKGKNIIIFNQILKSDKIYEVEINGMNNNMNNNFQKNFLSSDKNNYGQNSENFNLTQNGSTACDNHSLKNQEYKFRMLKNNFMNDNSLSDENKKNEDNNIDDDNRNNYNNINYIDFDNNENSDNTNTTSNNNTNNFNNNNFINGIKTKDIQIEKTNILNISDHGNNFNFSNSNKNYLLNYNYRKHKLTSYKNIKDGFINCDNKLYNISLNKINKSIKKKLRDIKNNQNVHSNKIKKESNVNKNINYFCNTTEKNEKEKNKSCSKEVDGRIVPNYENNSRNNTNRSIMNNSDNSNNNNSINHSINNTAFDNNLNIKRNILNLIDIEYMKYENRKEINNSSKVENKLKKNVNTDTIIDEFFKNEMGQEKNKDSYTNSNEDREFHKNKDNNSSKKNYYSKLTSINEEIRNTVHNNNDNDKVKSINCINSQNELLKKPLDYMMPPDLGIANRTKIRKETYPKENKNEQNSTTLRSLKSDNCANDPLNKLHMQYLPPDPKPQTKISFHKSIKKIDN